MDNFPSAKRKDEAAYGHYRIKDPVLEIYGALAESMRTGRPYQTQLDPRFHTRGKRTARMETRSAKTSGLAHAHSCAEGMRNMTKEPTDNKQPQKTNKVLPTQMPFIWPEARWHTKAGTYKSRPPFDSFLVDADLINGVIVGAWNGTVEWVHMGTALMLTLPSRFLTT